MGGQRHSIVYHGEWDRNARLKMHVNVMRPGKWRGVYYVLCLEQRVCVKKDWEHILISLYCEMGMSLVSRKWGTFRRVLNNAAMQMILSEKKKFEGKITRVKIRKLSQDHWFVIMKSEELGKLFSKLSGFDDWLSENVKECNESQMKFKNVSDLSYMTILIHFISKKNSIQANDLFLFYKGSYVSLFIVCNIIVSWYQLGMQCFFFWSYVSKKITGLQIFAGCERTFLSVLDNLTLERGRELLANTFCSEIHSCSAVI